MPVYEYIALDKNGKNRKGIIDADSTSSARKKLRAAGNYPINIKESSTQKQKKGGRKTISFSFLERIRAKEVHIFTRQIATLLGAKIPLIPALTSLINQTTNPAFKKGILL